MPSLAIRAAAEKERRRRAIERRESLPKNWRERARALFPTYTTSPFADRHADVWRWSETIQRGDHVAPFVAIWPRGGGKSTIAEMIAADLGADGRRVYCWYVCGTQEQADKHVDSISAMLEGSSMAHYRPEVGTPKVSKHGSQAWRRSFLRASNGFSVEAVGLNKQIRGGKIEEARPDLIILDDIDDEADSEPTIEKKKKAITTKILPAGSSDVAVLFVQNLIHADSIASMLADKTATGAGWLSGRIVSGPHPAVEDLVYDVIPGDDEGSISYRITAGVATWEGQDLETCEAQLGLWGPTAFLSEAQQDVDRESPLALWSKELLDQTRVTSSPELEYIAVAIDPPASVGICGIIGGGRATLDDGQRHGYTLADYSTPAGVKPNVWALAALQCVYDLDADVILVEVNNGGDMCEETIRAAKLRDEADNILVDGAHVQIIQVRASRGKATRAQPVATVYQQGRGHHVGYFPQLERQLTRWEPGQASPDRLDANVWLYAGLGLSDNSPSWESAQGLGHVEGFKSRWT